MSLKKFVIVLNNFFKLIGQRDLLNSHNLRTIKEARKITKTVVVGSAEVERTTRMHHKGY